MRRAAVAFVLLVTASGLGAQQSPAPTAAFTAIVRGRVFDAGSGVPLARAALTLYNVHPPAGRVLTDDRGQFELPVAALPVSLRVSKSGHATVVVPVSRPLAMQTLDISLPRAAAITGRVTDDLGQPISGRTVRARRTRTAANMPAQSIGETDDRGEYRLGGLGEGVYDISVITVNADVEQVLTTSGGGIDIRVVGAAMNESLARQNTLLAQGAPVNARDVSAITTVTLQQGAEVANIDLVTQPVSRGCGYNGNASQGDPTRTATVRGRVTAESGQPLRCATVTLRQPGVSPVSFPTSTDARGAFEFTGVAAGSFVIDAAANGYVSARYGQRPGAAAGTSVEVRDRAVVEGLDIALPRLPAINGVVVDERGEPMEGVTVRPLQVRAIDGIPTAMPPRGWAGGRTNDRGEYRIYGLAAGSYLLSAAVNATMSAAAGDRPRGYAAVFHPNVPNIDSASPVSLEDADVYGITIALSRTPTTRIAGLALDRAGRPFGGTVALLVSQRSGAIRLEPRQARVDANGAFEFDNVTRGEYVVQAFRRSLPDGSDVIPTAPGANEFGMQYVSVGDDDPPPVVLTTTPGPTVEGRMVIEGPPLEGLLPVFMTTMPADFDRSWVGGGTANMSPPADREMGHFKLVTVTGLRRFALSSGSREGYFIRSATVNGADALAVPFDFGMGETVFGNVEIVVARGGASIDGRAADERDRAVIDFTVLVFSTQRQHWYRGSQRLKVVQSRADGSFRMHSLPPDDYYVVAVERMPDAEADGQWPDPGLLEQLVPLAERLSINEGDRLTPRLRMLRR